MMGNYYKRLQPNSAKTRLWRGRGKRVPEQVKRSRQIKSTGPPTDGIYRFAANARWGREVEFGGGSPGSEPVTEFSRCEQDLVRERGEWTRGESDDSVG